MPSLFRYFAIVGSTLAALLVGINYLFAPPPEPVAAVKKPVVVVQHDPRASLMERWRNEQAALKAAEKPQAPLQAAPQTVAQPAPAPEAPVVTAAILEPEPQNVAPVALTTPAAPDAEALKAEKAKAAKAAKARKARLARERAAREQAASRQQDQYYYAQQQPSFAYAPPPPPRPLFGPFAGWGRGF